MKFYLKTQKYFNKFSFLLHFYQKVSYGYKIMEINKNQDSIFL